MNANIFFSFLHFKDHFIRFQLNENVFHKEMVLVIHNLPWLKMPQDNSRERRSYFWKCIKFWFIYFFIRMFIEYSGWDSFVFKSNLRTSSTSTRHTSTRHPQPRLDIPQLEILNHNSTYLNSTSSTSTRDLNLKSEP